MKTIKKAHLSAICLFFLIALYVQPGEILKNPGFEEDADLNGFPDNWIRQRLAVINDDPLDAFEGDISVKTSAFHGFIQGFPLSGGTRLGFSGFLRGDRGGERGALACEFRASGTWRHYQRNSWRLSSTYNPYTISLLAPPDADAGYVIILSLFNYDWISADALSLIDEFIHNPDFEELESGFPKGWNRVGNPIVDDSGQNAASGLVEARCDRYNYFSQMIAAYPEKKYKLILHVRSDDGYPTPETIRLSFLDDRQNPAGEIHVHFTANAAYSPFELDFTPPQDAVLMRLSLQTLNSPHSKIWFDALDLFAIAITPPSFSPNDDHIHDETSISFLLGRNTLVSAHILDQSHQKIRSLISRQNMDKGASAVIWDGYTDADGVAPPGDYALEVLFTNDLNEEVILTSPVVVSDSPPLEGWVKDFKDFFPRGVWMHLSGFYGEKTDYDFHLDILKQSGFNAILPNWIPDDRLQDLMSAADRAGASVIAHTSHIDALIGKYPDFFYQTVSETQWRDIATTCIAQLAIHPSLIGYYIKDEIREEYMKPALNAVRTLRGLDPERPAFSSLPRVSDLATPFNALDTAVLMHHYYPFGYARPITPDIFNGFCQNLENAFNAAFEKNRPLWMILQGMSLERSERMPTNEEMRCQVWLALAYGAKGVFYFLSQSSYELHGIFTLDGEPFPILETMKDINREIEILSPILLELQPSETFAAAIPDHAVRCWMDPEGVPYVFVVNKDCLSTKSVELTLDIMTVAGVQDVLTSKSLSFYSEAAKTRVPIVTPPGGGYLLRIETSDYEMSSPRRIPREALFSALSLPCLPLWKDYFVKPPSVSLDNALAGNVPLNGVLNDIAVHNGYAYIAALETGLHVVDVRKPWNPRYKETLAGHRYYGSTSVNDKGVFCADPRGGLVIFSPYETGALHEIGAWWGRSGSPLSLALKDDLALLAADSWGMTVLNVADPASPSLIARTDRVKRARWIIPNGDLAYILDEFQGVLVADVSSSAPLLLNVIPLSSPLSGAIRGNVMAIACGRYGIKTFSLEDPRAPVLTGKIDLPISESLGFFRDEWIFAAAGTDGVALIRLNEKAEPLLVKYHQPLPGYYARALFSDDYCIYVLYPYAGLYILSGTRVIDPEYGKRFHGFMTY